ncbi:maltose alpha-D-glucosyltransferase [Inquilinus sp. CAU 1745]|uniref:maltose alpha-D-glucosyltransferase n=1 Tax=Inquilinus sp. CAU 1745 TaxID=3140369 RepID=UPI00325AF06C
MNDSTATLTRATAALPPSEADPLWFKDAIVYQIHLKSFFDANNDGIGDFEGLIQKLDYCKEIGVTALWLLPFYPSPLRDDGYDIADYRGVNPSYGTMKDFRRFVREAHARDLKVITELVINHTSDQHPWFQRARRAKPGSNFRNFYVWSDDDKKWPETRIIFTDTEVSNWTWDPVAGAYFWHRFFSHQPDLNFDNPNVVKAVIDTMRFWLDTGVDGLRLDAIPYLVERDGTNNENLPETHAILKKLRAAMDESHPHAFFLAEANQWPEDTLPYFGEGDECQMAFHFPLMPRMYMAIAQEDRHPVTDIMRQTPEIPDNCQWAIFLRNHDELTLEMVTDRERDWMWDFYAADRRARINLGIRRRLAPLMGNDRRKIELMNSLLFSMPGTPIVYYGDEIGMGDNIFVGDRDGVRTPMQWSPDRNGGFSRADPASLFLPAIMDPVYGYATVNVEAQQRNASSQYNWMRRMIQVRRGFKAFGRGWLSFLYPGNRKVLAYLREFGDETVLCVANLSRQAQAVELDLARFKGRVPVELLGRSAFPPIGDLTYLLTLPAYGFYWFVLTEEAQLPSWHESIPEPMPDFHTLVLKEGWAGLIAGRAAEEFGREILPEFLAHQRWFGAKGEKIVSARVVDAVPLPSRSGDLVATLVEVDLAGRPEPERYLMPLALHWDEAALMPTSPLMPYTLAKIRRGPKLGALADGLADGDFAQAILDGLRRGAEIKGHEGRLEFTPGSGLADIALEPEDEVRRMGVEQSNTSILLGDKMVLKALRKLSPGVHPEVEIGRFLTEVAAYPNIPDLYGSVEHVAADGTRTAIAVLQEFIRNQGDGWTFTLAYLRRELEDLRLGLAAGHDGGEDDDIGARFGLYFHQAATLGRRTAELHRAFAAASGNPDFDPEPWTKKDSADLRAAIRKRAEDSFALLDRVEPPETVEADVQALVRRRSECLKLIDRLSRTPMDAAKTRHHGDFHLGQVLVDQADFVLVDFEGEPARSLAERRAKKTPLRDVAGMIRSFDYAAWASYADLAAESVDQTAELLAAATVWRDRSAEAFLNAYIQTAEGCVSFPGNRKVAHQLLDLLVLEKALYEIGYEAANRPTWLGIPVRGVAAILDAHAET